VGVGVGVGVWVGGCEHRRGLVQYTQAALWIAQGPPH